MSSFTTVKIRNNYFSQSSRISNAMYNYSNRTYKMLLFGTHVSEHAKRHIYFDMPRTHIVGERNDVA